MTPAELLGRAKRMQTRPTRAIFILNQGSAGCVISPKSVAVHQQLPTSLGPDDHAVEPKLGPLPQALGQ